MRRTLVLIVLLAAGIAYAQSKVRTVATNYTNLSSSCPTSATAGAALDEALGYAVAITADRTDAGTQTMFAAGTAKCCVYKPVTAGGSGSASTFRWMPCPTSLDFSLSECANLRDCTSAEFVPAVSAGRVAYYPSSAGVDGGTTATVSITVRVK